MLAAVSFAVADRGCGWAGDGGVGTEHGAVVVQDGGITHMGIDQGHLDTLVSQHAHDRLEPGATFCQLGSHGVSEPMRGDHGFALLVEQARGPAGDQQGVVEQVGIRQNPPVSDE